MVRLWPDSRQILHPPSFGHLEPTILTAGAASRNLAFRCIRIIDTSSAKLQSFLGQLLLGIPNPSFFLVFPGAESPGNSLTNAGP